MGKGSRAKSFYPYKPVWRRGAVLRKMSPMPILVAVGLSWMENMFRFLVAVSAFALLPACAHLPEWPALALLKHSGGGPPQTVYHFDWELSGSRAVTPLQVFDDGRRTWLQFAPQQAVPAIFNHSAGTDLPLPYVQEGPYVVLPGVWGRLVLRRGAQESLLRRLQPAAQTQAQHGASSASAASGLISSDVVPEPVSPAPPTAISAAANVPGFVPAATSTADAALAQVAGSAAPSALTPESGGPAGVAQLTAPSFALQVAGEGSHALADPPSFQSDLMERYEVSPSDQTLRAALDRWARKAGWTFQPEHWAVDADIPIVGSAHFEQPFKLAVRELVASTEMADRPLQPCFYSNRVLRIVPYAQRCDRGTGVARSS